MTVYQSNGEVTPVLITGTNTLELTSSDYINPITGATGVKTIKFDLVSATEPCTVSWTSNDETYTFANVAYTTDSVAGTGAEFNLTITSSSIVVTIVNPGVDYLADETFTVLGTEVGGETPENDVTLTIETVDTDGGIVRVVPTGTTVWPQSSTPTLVTSTGSQFVQVLSGTETGVFLSIEGADGTLFVQPVTIVG